MVTDEERELGARTIVCVLSAAGRISEASYLAKTFADRLTAFVDRAAKTGESMPAELVERLPSLLKMFALYADGFASLIDATQHATNLIPTNEEPE